MTIDAFRALLTSMISANGSDPDSASSIADKIILELQSNAEKRNKETEDKKTETFTKAQEEKTTGGYKA